MIAKQIFADKLKKLPKVSARVRRFETLLASAHPVHTLWEGKFLIQFKDSLTKEATGEMTILTFSSVCKLFIAPTIAWWLLLHSLES